MSTWSTILEQDLLTKTATEFEEMLMFGYSPSMQRKADLLVKALKLRDDKLITDEEASNIADMIMSNAGDDVKFVETLMKTITTNG